MCVTRSPEHILVRAKYTYVLCVLMPFLLFLLHQHSLQLDIDDTEMVKTKAEGRKRIQTTLPVYFGGVPAGLQDRVPEENVRTKDHFFGCIGDVTINGR